MLGYLPEILDGLFHILGDNNTEIRKMCEASLGEFLQGMSKSPQKVNYSGMVNILIAHSQNPDDVIKYTAITWLKEFVHISGRTMLPFAAGIITAVLPCLSYSDNGRKSIRDASRAVNNNLMRLIGPEDDGEILPSKESKDNKDVEEKDESKGDSNMDKDVMAVVNHILDTNNKNGEAIDYNTNMITLDVSSMVEVLTRQLLHESMQTRIAALRWIYHLHIKTPNKIFEHVEELFPLLLKTLSDPSDEVVLLDLEVLAEISSSPAGQRRAPFTDATMTIPSLVKHAVESSHSMNGYFTKFMISLLNLFSTDRQLLEDRGSFIIRQLCLLLNAEDIYRCCSEILLHEEDMKFASHMIQTLSAILLTSTELFDLRTQLKELKTEESCSLFCCLYNSWCHNPVATVALCLLTQNYQHTCALLQLFGDLEVTVEFLTEIDKLVQLIESPIFTYLRLQLLDVQHNQHLIKSLYGLLMLLPQSDAFQTLRHRLECVPHFHFPSYDKNIETTENTNDHKPASKHIDFEELLKHFKAIQSKHRASRRLPRTMET